MFILSHDDLYGAGILGRRRALKLRVQMNDNLKLKWASTTIQKVDQILMFLLTSY